LSQELQTELTKYIEAVIQARFEFQNPDFSADVVEIHSALVAVQEVLTSIENYLSRSMRAKSAADRRVSLFRMQWQEVWDKAIVNAGKRPSFGDYSTGKERAADANLAAFEEARQLNQAEELLSFANEAVDIIRLHYYGLDKIRQDLRKRLDLQQTSYYQA